MRWSQYSLLPCSVSLMDLIQFNCCGSTLSLMVYLLLPSPSTHPTLMLCRSHHVNTMNQSSHNGSSLGIVSSVHMLVWPQSLSSSTTTWATIGLMMVIHWYNSYNIFNIDLLLRVKKLVGMPRLEGLQS